MSSSSEPLLPPPAYTDPQSARALLAEEDDDFAKFSVTVEQSDVAIRLAFVRKVYSILATQFALTTIVSAFCMYNQSVKNWTQQNSYLVFVSSIGTLITFFALILNRKKHPVNLQLLGLFTLLESYAVGTVVSYYDSQIVLQAVILTFALFIGLTLFTLQSKWDFDRLGPFLFGSLLVVFCACFLQVFLPFSRILDLILAIVIAIVFCGYIVYDTFQIFERLSPEEYIIAAVELYLDVLNLFLAILRILSNSRD